MGMNKNMEEANLKIEQLTKEVEALKSVKSVNTTDQIQQFRMEQIQKRSNEMELEIKAKDLELEEAKIKIHELSQFATSSNEQSMISKQVNVRDQMGKEFKNLFDNDYKQLFDLIFDLMTCYDETYKYEKTISATLCEAFSINKQILYES